MNVQAVIHKAVAQGLLPADTSVPEDHSRPWPVLLLVALGAWLAALPLLVVVGLLLGDWVTEGAGTYVIGTLVLAAALVTLRSQPLHVFVEQLALPALLVGGGALVAGLFRDVDEQAAAALSCLLVLGVVLAVPLAWLRVLLGALAALLFGLACLPVNWDAFGIGDRAAIGLALHLMLAVWLLALLSQARAIAAARMVIEPLQAGWLLATLAGLALWSGLPMFLPAAMGGFAGWWPGSRLPVMPVASLLLALAAALFAARRWPSLRKPWCAAAVLPLLALCAVMPALGATLLALVVCATASRWRLAAAAGVAAAWIVGAFYYLLAWPLQSKALLLVAAGALLGGLAWWVLRPHRTASARVARSGVLGLAASVLAVLVVANVGIWQKEQLITHGQPLLVELRPVDPRSLMQGDYMTLAFALPGDIADPAAGLLTPQRPRLWARRDARGVASWRKPDAEAPRGADEIEVELTPKGGEWTLVTDAWFFAEGESQRWAAARYGEFRVDASGRSLLVGLRGADLRPL